MIRFHPKNGSQFKGQGIVEFALTLPIFLILMYGIFEFGRLIFIYSSVLNASREAARYAAASDAVQEVYSSTDVFYKDCTGIRNRAQQVSSIVDLSATDAVQISYLIFPHPTTVPIYMDCPADVNQPCRIDECSVLVSSGYGLKLGDRVEVTVTSLFNPIIPINSVIPVLNVANIPVSSTTTRSLVTGINIWEQ